MERLGDTLKELQLVRNISQESTAGPYDAEPLAGEVCAVCRGAGYLRHDVPPGHPDFGKIVACQCRNRELDEQHRRRLEKRSNLGALTRLTFEAFADEGLSGEPAQRASTKQACAVVRQYADSAEGWLILIGPPGCGKTHLAAAVANERIARGEEVFFMVVPDLLDHLRATFSPTSDISYDELFERMKETPLLVLDDLGTQSSTPWAQEKLYQILNHRYNTRLPTIVTTNRKLHEIDVRLRSRMTDACLSRVVLVQDWHSLSLQKLVGPFQELLRHMTFETFDSRGMSMDPQEEQHLRQALTLAKKYAANPSGWLVLTGGVGRGKTHLAAAIANYRLSRGEAAYFVVVADLLDHLRAAFSPDSVIGYDELFEAVRTVPLLVLDDLRPYSTPWAEEKLYQLLNYRYVARAPLVVTTSVPLEELDERISSRLLDQRVSTCFSLLGPALPPDVGIDPLERGRRRSTARRGTGVRRNS